MKKQNELFAEIVQAYLDARRNKRNTQSQLAFEMNLEANLIQLHQQIETKSYTPSPSTCFIVNKPIKREIFASSFKDRVVHHLLYNRIAPIFEKTFIYDSYACRKGKGTLLGVRRIEHHIRSCTNNYTKSAYILKLDIKGYFMSINKEILWRVITKKLTDSSQKKTELTSQNDSELNLFLIEKILFNNPTENCIKQGRAEDWQGLPKSKSLFYSDKGIGLAIGDLTSQLFSNIYMNQFDQYVKRELKIKHYGRYVDDFYVIHTSKVFITNLIAIMRTYLRQTLGLTLHPNKIYLQHVSKGVQYLGIMIKPYRSYVGTRTVDQFNDYIQQIIKQGKNNVWSSTHIRQIRSTLNSHCGYFAHHKTHSILKKKLNILSASPCLEYAPNLRKVILTPIGRTLLIANTNQIYQLKQITAW